MQAPEANPRTLPPAADRALARAGQLVWPASGASAQFQLDGRAYAPEADSAHAGASGDDLAGVAQVTLPDSRRESEQQLSLALEAARLTALADKRIDLGRRYHQATSESSAKWAADRHAACSRPLGPRVAACGTRGLGVRCGCGPRVFWRGCRQWWVCERCRAARLRPLAPRLLESIAARVEEAQAGGRRVGIRLVTIALRTSGNVDDDRAELGASWRRWYQAMHKWIGRHAYAGVYEVTPGETGRGHVHAHVLLVWPRWLDYGRVRSLWLAAARGRSTRIDIRGIDGDARRAAGYVCKYLSKGSGELAPDLAGRVIAAFYGRRAITASRRFWLPRAGCRRCGEAVVRVDLVAWGVRGVGLWTQGTFGDAVRVPDCPGRGHYHEP